MAQGLRTQNAGTSAAGGKGWPTIELTTGRTRISGLRTRSKVDFYSCTFTLGILPTHHFPIQRGDMFLLSVTKER